jgi:two-component system chemotaxis response regulator CheY
MLTQMEFTNIKESDDGVNAWPLIESASAEGASFDFIISDWNMPEMSGIELLKKVRSTDHSSKIPFIMVTAESEKDNLVMAVKEGVSDFITKPFTFEILQAKMNKIFK